MNTDASGHHERAGHLLRLRRYADLELFATEALAVDPTNVGMLGFLAEAQLMLGNVDAASVTIRSALHHEPGLVELVSLHARVLVELGETAEALSAAQRALTLDSGSFQAQVIHVRVLFAAVRTSDYLDVRELWDRIEASVAELLRSFPHHPSSHVLDARLQLCFGRTGHARLSAERAIRLDPNWAAAHEMHGEALQAMGKAHAAGQSFVTAGKLQPESGRHAKNVVRLVEGTEQRLEFVLLVLLFWAGIGAVGRLTIITFIFVPVACLATRPMWRRLSTRRRSAELSAEVVAVSKTATRH